MFSARIRPFASRCLGDRFFSDAKPINGPISPLFTNRNPRNLERLRIGYKPDGYHLDNPGKCFWHKLTLTSTGRYVTASLIHFENGEVIKASTQEWALRKRLYKTNDIAAYFNLGRVFTRRCLESGIIEMMCTIEAPNEEGKVASFLKAVTDGGLVLKESPQYKKPLPQDQLRPEKPWEITN